MKRTVVDGQTDPRAASRYRPRPFVPRAALVLALLLPLWAAGPSNAGPIVPISMSVPLVVAAPAASVTGFLNNVTINRGTTLKFLNPDELSPHNVTSKATRTVKVGRRNVRVPLFVSADAGFMQVIDVTGTQKLKVGKYTFLCTLHPSMTGVLTVQ